MNLYINEFFFSDLKNNLYNKNFNRLKSDSTIPLTFTILKNKFSKRLQLSFFEKYFLKRIDLSFLFLKIVSKVEFFIEIKKFYNFQRIKIFFQIFRKIFRRFNLGFFSTVEVKGLGFKYFLIGHNFYAELGQSHSFVAVLSRRLDFSEKKEKILFFSTDYGLLNNTLLQLRSLKKPDSYKGKGVLFNQETINLKPGKKKS